MLTDQQRYQGLSADLVETTKNLLRDLQSHDFDAAANALGILHESAPEHPEVLRLQAAFEFFACNNAAGALALLLKALPLRPRDALIYHLLGQCYERLRDSVQSVKAYECACIEGPEQPQFWFDYGRAQSHAGCDGTAAFERVVRLDPNHQPARAMLASTRNMKEGHADEAEIQHRKLLASDPGYGPSWWGLALLRPMPLDADDVLAMRTALSTLDIDDVNRAVIHFALAHALEAQRDYPAALASLHEAHALAATTTGPWDGVAMRASLEQTLQAFDSPRPAQQDDIGREVIFIVSLPRSGSTLIEQILASHSQVTGTSELHDLIEIIEDADRRNQAPMWQWGPALDADGWRSLGETYLERTAHWRRDRPRFTDKMPANWRSADAILSMLPNARIVMVRRDPLENCLACYRVLLPGLAYVHTFAGLAEASRQYDFAIDILQARYPERVRVQSYEALTVDPGSEIRALLDFCDLPFEQSCIDFHATRRRVTTLSASQVRQPMRRDTARADKYGALLDPLREALGLPAFESVKTIDGGAD